MKNQKMNRMKFVFNQINDDDLEIEISDYIAKEKSTDWWTGEQGNEFTAKEFKEKMDSSNAQNITIRMNSGGGDVFVANEIISSLNRAKDNGKKTKCIIESICASAAVGIARTCENVQIENGAYMMIHNPMTMMFGYYGANELENNASFLNKIKDGIVDIYEAKTKCGRTKLKNMMDAETWMTAKEAVENGFADEVIHDKKEEEVINSFSKVVFNSIQTVPQAIKNALDRVEKGETEMEIKNKADLEKAYPNFINEIKADAIASVKVEDATKEAVNKERERIKAIDEMQGKVDAEVLNKAKYETLDTAEKVALEAIKNGNFVNTAVLNGLSNESHETDGVKNAVNDGLKNEGNSKEDTKNQAAQIAQDYFKKQGKE